MKGKGVNSTQNVIVSYRQPEWTMIHLSSVATQKGAVNVYLNDYTLPTTRLVPTYYFHIRYEYDAKRIVRPFREGVTR